MKNEDEVLKKLERTKIIYDNMEIPDELTKDIEKIVMQNKENHSNNRKNVSAVSFYKKSGIVAAAVIVIFIIVLNTNQAFAAAMDEIPLVGKISRVLTFRTYQEVDEDKRIVVEEPRISEQQADEIEDAGEKEELEEFVVDINTEIEKIIQDYKDQAAVHIEEYKKAYIETGGTEEEFEAKGIRVDINYEVKFESERYISLVITANENWCNAYGVQYFYNVDLKEQKELSLRDILGDDWIGIATKQMKNEMKLRMEEDEYLKYWEEFVAVDENTDFYLNEKGNPVLVYEKYSIAPGCYGIQEFEIEK